MKTSVKHSRRDYLILAIVFIVFLLIGWGIGRLSNDLSGNYLVKLILDANEELYYARVGYPNEPKQYFIFGDDFSALNQLAKTDEQLFEFESPKSSGLTSVTVLPPYQQAFEKLNRLPGIKAVMTIPYFCH